MSSKNKDVTQMNWKSHTEERKMKFCNLHLTKDVIFADGGMPVQRGTAGRIHSVQYSGQIQSTTKAD